MRSRGALFTTTAVLEAVTGLALLFVPAEVIRLLFGISAPSAAALLAARVLGGALFALGVAAGLARSRQARSRHSMLITMLAYNVGISVALALAGTLGGLFGVLLWPAVLLHAVMALWCIADLRAAGQDV